MRGRERERERESASWPCACAKERIWEARVGGRGVLERDGGYSSLVTNLV